VGAKLEAVVPKLEWAQKATGMLGKGQISGSAPK